MGDSTKKKHHYTPNFILRGFATPAERLWVLDKRSGHCWAKDGGPDARFDAFAENNYNSLLDSEGNRDTSIEDHLEKIEDVAAPIVRDLVGYATAGIYPILSDERRAQLAQFLWAQHLRSPCVRERLKGSQDARRYFEQVVERATRLFGLDAAQAESLLGRPEEFVGDAAKMMVMQTETHRTQRFMTAMSVDLVTVADPAGHFVTSDRPCLIEPVATTEGKVLMALTKAVMLQLSRPDDSRGEVIPVDADTVERLNRQTFRTATRFVAGPSQQYLNLLWGELVVAQPLPEVGTADR